MLIVDEVQCGLGRTGSYFAIEESGVRPDILVIAKVWGFYLSLSSFFSSSELSSELMGYMYDQGLGNGFPISGVVSRTELTDRLKPGSMVCSEFGLFFLVNLTFNLS